MAQQRNLTSDPLLTDPSRAAAALEAALPFRLRLRFRREQAGLRQWEVADALGLHNTLLSAYENGRRRPSDADAFDQRHQAAIQDALHRRVSSALQEADLGDTIVLRHLSRDAADACLHLVEALARATRLPLDARLTRERGAAGSRLRVRLGPAQTPGATAAAPDASPGKVA